MEQISRVATELDPIRDPGSFFDPSNPLTIARFVGIALVAQERHPLAAVPTFYGSGVYALYYNDGFAPYKPLAGSESPVYVGKADPAHPNAKTPREQGPRLAGRLRDHARSIRKTSTTLDVSHFSCRHLVVQSGWQMAAEEYLIDFFKPIWNDDTGICYGLGKHGDSPHIRANLRSPWDILHPGREWASRDPNILDAIPRHEIIERIVAHLQSNPPFPSVEAILKRFIDDLRQH